MLRVSTVLLLIGVLTALSACAGTPGPGEGGYPFNLSGSYQGAILVEGMSFDTSLDLRTGPGGRVEGSYAVTNPVSMSGDLAGTLVADTARFSMDYVNPMDGCSGTLEGTGVVEAGGESFAGRARINDACNGSLSGTFRFTK